jgi:hypothetical protein
MIEITTAMAPIISANAATTSQSIYATLDLPLRNDAQT